MRTKLQEIPELGISAKGSYAIQEGTSISEIYHEAAGMHNVSAPTNNFDNTAASLLPQFYTASAYEEILASDPSGPIKDGSYHFKKRFIALSRAGKQWGASHSSAEITLTILPVPSSQATEW